MIEQARTEYRIAAFHVMAVNWDTVERLNVPHIVQELAVTDPSVKTRKHS